MAKNDGMSRGGNSDVTPRADDPGFWRELWRQVRLVFQLLRDPEVPFYLKLLPIGAVLYVLFPLDFAPDIYPVIGQLDDLTALLVGAKVFVELAPPHVVAKYTDRLQPQTGTAVQDNDDDQLKEAIIIDAEHELVREKQPEDLE